MVKMSTYLIILLFPGALITCIKIDWYWMYRELSLILLNLDFLN